MTIGNPEKSGTERVWGGQGLRIKEGQLQEEGGMEAVLQARVRYPFPTISGETENQGLTRNLLN